MTRSARALLVVAGAALFAACTTSSGGTAAAGPGPAGPAAAELTPAMPAADSPLMYDVPSPATVTYEVADTMVTVMNVAGNDMDMTMGSSATVELSFERGDAGLVVSGVVLDFSSSTASAMAPTMSAGLDDLEGDLEFVLAPRGEVEVKSLPSSSSAMAPVTTFQTIANQLFPRFPDGQVEAGDMWADTLEVSADDAGLEEAELAGLTDLGGGSSTITTYTLVGDTVVAGRSLLHVTIKTEGSTSTSAEVEGQGELTQDMVNVTEGFFLWDPERRLITAVELTNTVDGSMMAQDMAMTITGAGTVRVRLVNQGRRQREDQAK